MTAIKVRISATLAPSVAEGLLPHAEALHAVPRGEDPPVRLAVAELTRSSRTDSDDPDKPDGVVMAVTAIEMPAPGGGDETALTNALRHLRERRLAPDHAARLHVDGDPMQALLDLARTADLSGSATLRVGVAYWRDRMRSLLNNGEDRLVARHELAVFAAGLDELLDLGHVRGVQDDGMSP